ncbi:MAG: MBL fold metallo-hydrolase [Chloroflexota bacterium]
MTTVTVLAGERTIGGTQIVIEDEGARLLFDCGLAYDPAGDPFAHVHRRSWRTLQDLLALGSMPFVQGLYGPAVDGARSPTASNAQPLSEGPLVVAVSHAHLDHSHLIGFVDPSVPIYASQETIRIAQVQSDTGINAGPITRSLSAVEPGDSFDVGPMKVRFLPVDHDLGGACGLIVETTDGVIAYSGDLRLHGAHPTRTLAFAQAAREAGVRLFIEEGTRLFPPAPDQIARPQVYERVEDDVVPEIMTALEGAHGRLGVVILTPENAERVERLAEAVHHTGRLFVIDPEGLAFVVAALGRPLNPPHGVYVPTEIARLMAGRQELPPTILTAFSPDTQTVTASEIAANGGDYLLRLPFTQFADLLDLVPRGGGGVIVAANGTPLGRFDPAWTHLEWWARFFGMEIAERASSGHATPHDLTLIAALTGAPIVMPVHSFHPELMPLPEGRVLLPQRGTSYQLAHLG